MQNNFAGFDIRIGHPPFITLDGIYWDINEMARQAVVSQGGSETPIQLLDADIRLIETVLDANSSAIALFPSDRTRLLIERQGKWISPTHSYTRFQLAKRGWSPCGYDVVDINGFFSLFGIDGLAESMGVSARLFDHLEQAECAAISASSLIPSHAPFGVFSISVFPRRKLNFANIPDSP